MTTESKGITPPLTAYNNRMSECIHKSHNVSILMYHLVFPEKYRRVVFEGGIENKLKKI